MKINQSYFSNSVSLFKNNFNSLWKLRDYNNIYEPCIFAGIYNKQDIEKIKKHKGFKVVWICGSDIKNINEIVNEDVIFRVSKTENLIQLRNAANKKIKIKEARFHLRDYSIFKPSKLGNKIYCYIGNTKKKEKYRYDVVKEIEKLVNYDIMFGIQGRDIEHIIKNYYNNCFVNIRLNPFAGGSTTKELAYMGRYTISNVNGSMYINYKNIHDIVNIINKEAEKIGTVQPSLVDESIHLGEEWKNINFWK